MKRWFMFRFAYIEVLSCGYRLVRLMAIKLFTLRSVFKKLPFDLETVIVWGDRALHRVDRFAGRMLHNFSIPEGQSVFLHDLQFPSPVVVSSFKDDPIILGIWLKMGLGGVMTKTILSHPHLGNPRPRIADLPAKKALINAMGLPGPGIEGLERMLKSHPQLFAFGRPIGISVGGRDLDEYKSNFSKLNQMRLRLPAAHANNMFFELNISCPNTKEGQDLCKHQDLLKDLLGYIRRETDAVVGVKLSPGQSNQDLLSYAQLVASYERTYVNVGNTQYRTCQDVRLPASALSVGGGGLSGAPLYERTLEMTRLLKEVALPIVATGGVHTVEQARELREAGAVLIGVATGLVKDPYAIVKMIQSKIIC